MRDAQREIIKTFQWTSKTEENQKKMMKMKKKMATSANTWIEVQVKCFLFRFFTQKNVSENEKMRKFISENDLKAARFIDLKPMSEM